ncbi:MAG: hypothetical protein QQN63_00110 [Nitrosopumilus sp.]
MICSQIIAVGLHLASWHSSGYVDINEKYSEYNNLNVGAYVRTSCNIQVGVYYNSIGRVTVYGAYVLDSDNHPFFAYAGAATGYNKNSVVPLGGVGVKVSNFRITYTPAISKYNSPHLIHMTYEF